MKNQGIVNFLIDNNMMLDQCSSSISFGVDYLELNNSVQYDSWSARTLWDEIEKDDVTILSICIND